MRNRELRFRRILCAVDFSPASLRAFDFAIKLAETHGARIHLLHVIQRIVASVLDIPIATSRWTAEQEAKAQRELPRLMKRAAASGVTAKEEIRIGDVDVQILRAARDYGADLLVMGTHGRRGFERWAMGSVAERMIRYSRVPLLVVAAQGRASSPARIRQILIPIDFSAETGELIRYGIAVGRQAGASITMLHVINDRSVIVDWNVKPNQKSAIHRKLEALIPSTVKRLGRVKSVVETGEPYRVILGAIKKLKPSMVIMNTHGRGFLHRVLIGSTADRVVRGGASMCPILLLPPSGKAASRR